FLVIPAKAGIQGKWQSGRPWTPAFAGVTTGWLRGGADGGGFDVVADAGLVLAEVLLEIAGEAAGGGVVGLFVGPGRARVEDFGRDVGGAFGDEEAEIRVLAHRRVGE